MTRPTKRNQVTQGVCSFVRIKASERPNVVNIQCLGQLSLCFSAVLAFIAGTHSRLFGLLRPIWPFIVRIFPAFPEWASFSTKAIRSPFILAKLTTKAFPITLEFHKWIAAKLAMSHFLVRFRPACLQITLHRAVFAIRAAPDWVKWSPTSLTIVNEVMIPTFHSSIISQDSVYVKEYCRLAQERVARVPMPMGV